MRPDDRADAALQEQDILVDLRKRLFQAIGILRAVGVADNGEARSPFVRDMLCVVLRKLFDALLPSARDAGERKLAIERDVEQRLHVELRSGERNRGGDAATAAKRLEIIDHELGVDVVARFLGPIHHLLGGKPPVTLANGLIDQEPFGNRCQQRVDYVQLGFGMLGHELVADNHSGVVAAGQAA